MRGRPRLSHTRGLRDAPEQLEFTLGPLPGHLFFVPQPPHLFQLCLQVTHRLIHQQLLERPLLDVARLVLLQVVDVLHRARQDRTLGLFTRAVRHDASELVDAFVDIASSSAFDLFLKMGCVSTSCKKKYAQVPYMVVLSLARPLVRAHGRISAPAGPATRPSPTTRLRLVALVAIVLIVGHVLGRRAGRNVRSLGSDARCWGMMAQVGGPTRVRRWAGLAHAGRWMRDRYLVRCVGGQLVLASALEWKDARLGEGLERLGGIGWDVDLTGGLVETNGKTQRQMVFFITTEDHVLC